jgi:hypothetical protein
VVLSECFLTQKPDHTNKEAALVVLSDSKT